MTDNRRLTLWVAFGLVLLGGIGLDRLARRPPRAARGRAGPRLWAAAALGAAGRAGGRRPAEPGSARRAAGALRQGGRARRPGADPAVYRDRAERQVRQTLDFVPRYLGLAGGPAARAGRARRGAAARRLSRPRGPARPCSGLTLIDLFGFGFGLNPAIDAADDRPSSPVIAYLRRRSAGRAGSSASARSCRPTSLMRYGLADVRNYDSVELARSLDWFAPLYEPGRRGADQPARRSPGTGCSGPATG